MQPGELRFYLNIIWRRLWLIAIIVGSTLGVITYTSLTAEPVYRATVKLQVLAPESQEVVLFTPARPAALTEEIDAVQQEFAAAIKSGLVAWKTIADLNLTMSASELLERLTINTDREFLIFTTDSENPEEAEAIATTHVNNALAYYGEVRAKPAAVALEFLSEQLDHESKAVAAAKDALLQFKLKNNVESIEREIAAYQELVRSLRLERDRAAIELDRLEATLEQRTKEAQKAQNELTRLTQEWEKLQAEKIADDLTKVAAQATAAATKPTAYPTVQPLDQALEEFRRQSKIADLEAQIAYWRRTAENMESQAIETQIAIESYRESLVQYDRSIAQREADLLALIGLSAQYNDLEAALQQAESNYNFLLSKQNEARLKESQARDVGFIQIIEPARLPEAPARPPISRLLLVGGAISLAASLLLVFVLEFIQVQMQRTRNA